MKPAPFNLTKDAEEMIRHMLASTKDDMEPALSWTPSLERRSKEGTYLGRYDGPMVYFGHYRNNDRPRDSFFEVCGQSVSILPATLEHIAGKTIALEQVEMHHNGQVHREFVFTVG